MPEQPPPIPQTPGCSHCGAILDRQFNFCPHCGKRLEPEPAKAQWYYEPLWIAVMALLALGPFALPMVFKSSKLSRNGKIIFSVSIVVYTIMLVVASYKIAMAIVNSVMETSGMMDMM